MPAGLDALEKNSFPVSWIDPRLLSNPTPNKVTITDHAVFDYI
jgi:hypothetical protein